MFPGQGHKRTEVKDSRYLFWNVYSYVIVYYYDDKNLYVVRVLHGSRNFRTVFRKRK